MKLKPRNENKDKSETLLIAAALQDHILRERKILPRAHPPQLPSLSKIGKGVNASSKKTALTLPELIQEQNENSKGLFNGQTLSKIQKEQMAYNKKLSLAQKMNLVPAPKAPLTVDQWRTTLDLAQSQQRTLDTCAICLEPFKVERQVLLDCSHVFHKHCFETFEKVEKCRSCPICRAKDYQKIDIAQAAIVHLNRSATLIQAHFKRYQAEETLYKMIKQADAERLGDKLKRKALLFKMKKMSLSTLKEMKASRRQINKLVNDQLLETKIADGKELIEAYVAKYRDTLLAKNSCSVDVDWNDVAVNFYKRKEKECSICLGAFTVAKDNYLLSCSHAFHTNCLLFFERHSTQAALMCPLCRAEYQRRAVKYDAGRCF